jgi:hypothetical protein
MAGHGGLPERGERGREEQGKGRGGCWLQRGATEGGAHWGAARGGGSVPVLLHELLLFVQTRCVR